MTRMHVTRHRSGAPWEPVLGYVRAVRSGTLVAVSGTTSVRDGEVVGDTPADQARVALGIVLEALAALGARPADVVQTRILLTDADSWDEVAPVHREVFGAHPPAATLVAVPRLLDPRMQVEVEALAVVPAASVAPPRAPGEEGDGGADYAPRPTGRG